MKQKILSFLLILTLIAASAPIAGIEFGGFLTAEAADTLVWGDYEYTIINENSIQITDYLGEDAEVAVPAEIDGMPVTIIGTDCFSSAWGNKNTENKKNIKKIILPEGVEQISSDAFAYCSSLEYVNIPNSVKSLGYGLFYSCDNLKELTLPGKDITYSINVFSNSSIEKINFSEGMTLIPQSFFSETKVTSVTIPSSVTSIDERAFYRSLVDTVIFAGPLSEGFYPASEDNFQFMLKKYSPALMNVYFRYFPSNMPHSDTYNVVYDEASGYWHCTYAEDYSSYEVHNDGSFDYVINENGEAVLIKYTGWNPYIVIPETVGFVGINYGVVTEIGSGTFTDTGVTKVIIPDTVKRIGSYAFKNCSTVATIEIPDSVEKIGNCAFYGCTALEALTLPESVTEIGIKAFMECTALKSVNWPSAINYVPADAFWNCSSFNDFGIFENVEIISGGAFKGCSSLIIDDFGDKIKEIGDFAFTGNVVTGGGSEFAVINAKALPESLEYLGDRAFANNVTLKQTTIPENMKHIGNGVFYCSALEQIDILAPLKEISKCMFAKTSLKSIDLPDTVEKIGDCAFYECLSLEGIEFPDTVTYIGNGAFEACESFSLLALPPNLYKIGERSFAGLVGIYRIYIPSNVKIIGERAFDCCNNVTKIIIENGVEVIGNYAFSGNKATTITIPESVRDIGHSIISDTAIKTVYYNSIELDSNLYRSTSESLYPIFSTDTLKKIVFGKNVKLVPAFCSYECDSLEQIVFSSSIREIDIFAFAFCDSLKYIAIPGGVQKIDNGAFRECTNLETAVIPDSVTEIHEYAFYGCENLTIICNEGSYAYTYAAELGIPTKLPSASPAPDKGSAQAEKEQYDPKQIIADSFNSLFDSVIAKIKEFFAQFTIIRR